MSSSEDESNFTTRKPINGGYEAVPVKFSYSSFDRQDSQLLFPVSPSSLSLQTAGDDKKRPSSPIYENQYSSRKPLTPNTNGDLYSRYKYYSRLSTPGTTPFKIPDHVLPRDFFVLPLQAAGEKQSSIVTIFSTWNAMIGSSLLSMPWAIYQSGWLMGIALILIMCFISLYSVILILKYDKGNGINGKVIDFADLAEFYFGRVGSYVCLIASVGIMWGASLGYCILMSGFLYEVGDTICFWVTGQSVIELPAGSYWTQEYVTIGVMILVFPLTLAKDFGFIAKLTSIGTVSVLYLILFVIYWTGKTGVTYGDAKLFNSNFYFIPGIFTLSFFIHNAILNIMRNQKNPENNARDASIAYMLVLVSYAAVALLYYFTIEKKECISDNFLKDVKLFDRGNVGLFIAQFLLFFQMITVFPLLTFIIRFQGFSFFFKDPYPKFTYVFFFHLLIATTCVLMGVFYPKISVVLRFTGAIFGLLAVFILPIGFHLKELKMKNKLSWASGIFHFSLIAFGVANLFAQFFAPLSSPIPDDCSSNLTLT